MSEEIVVRFAKKKPNFYQRAEWHDYTSRCFYMVTFNKSDNAPQLSIIRGSHCGKTLKVWAELTECGKTMHGAINSLRKDFPCVEISHPVIMPNHVHLIVYVKESGVLHLGEVVRKLKSECSERFKAVYPESLIAIRNESLFCEGYNDRIVHKRRQLSNFHRYISDNPRRHYLRVNSPQYFCKSLDVNIDGEIYSIFGNFLLLRHPEKSCVRISRKFSESELMRRRKEWEEVMRGSGVLVSPFISKDEKKIRDEGIERGVSIIRIVENGFPERYKPQGSEFDLCSEGRLLLIAPKKFNSRKEAIKREQCLALNNLAERIASADGEMRLILRR